MMSERKIGREANDSAVCRTGSSVATRALISMFLAIRLSGSHQVSVRPFPGRMAAAGMEPERSVSPL